MERLCAYCSPAVLFSASKVIFPSHGSCPSICGSNQRHTRRCKQDSRKLFHGETRDAFAFNVRSTLKQDAPSGQDKKPAVHDQSLSVPSSDDAASLPSWLTKGNGRALGVILINIVTVLYSTNFSIVKELDRSMPPSSAAFLRFSLAALVFLPAMRNLSKGVLLAGSELGFWLWGGFAFQAIGLQYTSADKCAFIASLAVIMVPVLESIFQRKVFSGKIWAAAILALIGTGFLELSSATGPNVGDAWCLLMSLFWAVDFIRLEKYSTLFPPEKLAGTQLAVVAALSGIWMLFERQTVDFSAVPWPAILYTGFVTTALTSWLDVVILRYISAVEATIFFSLEPIWASLFSFFLFQEVLGPKGLIGGAMIIASCIGLQLSGQSSSQPKP